MTPHRLLAGLFALAIAGCAQMSQLPSGAGSPTTIAAPKLNAEQTLQRLLELLRTKPRVAELNGARLSKAFGVQFTPNGTNVGYGEQVAAEWWSSIELLTAPPNGPRLDVMFQPAKPGTYPPMTDICRLDYNRFEAELKAMGFKHQTYRGEHGRIVSQNFDRGGMSIRVHTQGEADHPTEKITHACVRMVLVS